MDGSTCPFCADGVDVLANEMAFARRDAHPVTPGHTLVLTRRHVADFFETTAEERQALLALLQQARDLFQRERQPHVFNVGINVGEAQGNATRWQQNGEHARLPQEKS